MKQNAEYRKVIAKLMYKHDYVKNELLPATRNVARHLRVVNSEDDDEEEEEDNAKMYGDRTRNAIYKHVPGECDKKRKRPPLLLSYNNKKIHQSPSNLDSTKPQSSLDNNVWPTPAYRAIQQLKEEKLEYNDRYWQFRGPINQLFNLFRDSDIVSKLPVKYKTQKTVGDRPSFVPSVLFVEFIVLNVIQHCAKLPRHANNAFEGGHYGDLHYATRALAAWYKTTNSDMRGGDDEENGRVLSAQAIDAYLRTHFHNDCANQAVVFKPIKDNLTPIIMNPDQQPTIDTYRYMPKAYIGETGIKYPTPMTTDIWPLTQILGTVCHTVQGASNIDLLQIGIIPPIQRYTLWGMAVLSLLWALANVYMFTDDLVQYLNSIPPDVFERYTSSELFPGLYMMLMTSRPRLRESRSNFGLTMDMKFVGGTEPIAYKPLQYYYKACFKCITGGVKKHKDDEGGDDALNRVEVYSELLFQYCEMLMNDIYKDANTYQRLDENLRAHSYASAMNGISRTNIFYFLKTGFISKTEQKTLSIINDSAISRNYQNLCVRALDQQTS